MKQSSAEGAEAEADCQAKQDEHFESRMQSGKCLGRQFFASLFESVNQFWQQLVVGMGCQVGVAARVSKDGGTELGCFRVAGLGVEKSDGWNGLWFFDSVTGMASRPNSSMGKLGPESPNCR